MGCDIHAYVERLNGAGEWEFVDIPVFDCRAYGIFGFLADVRNYSLVPPITEPRGLPDSLSPQVANEAKWWNDDMHTESWLIVSELARFDYNQYMNDRRVKRQIGPNSWDCGATGAPEEGTVKTYRDFLGDWYMREIERLASVGDPDKVRVVFWFDN